MIVLGIPAYNEEEKLGQIIQESKNYVNKIIVCDDGSTDHTSDVAKSFGVEVVSHQENLGYGKTIQTLFKEALKYNVEILVTIDGDGQHEPSDIPKLLLPIISGKADIVAGSRVLGETDAKLYRKIGVEVLRNFTGKASGNTYTDSQCGFRAYNRKALDALALTETGMGVSAEILIKAEEQHLRIVEVPVTIHYKGLNTSKHNPVSHGLSVVGAILRVVVERKPLTYLGIPSLFSIIIGGLFSIWTLQIYSVQRVLVTNLALTGIFFMVVGMNLLSASVMFYVLSRIRMEIRTR